MILIMIQIVICPMCGAFRTLFLLKSRVEAVVATVVASQYKQKERGGYIITEGERGLHYYYCICHPTMCSMSFNNDHS